MALVESQKPSTAEKVNATDTVEFGWNCLELVELVGNVEFAKLAGIVQLAGIVEVGVVEAKKKVKTLRKYVLFKYYNFGMRMHLPSTFPYSLG